MHFVAPSSYPDTALCVSGINQVAQIVWVKKKQIKVKTKNQALLPIQPVKRIFPACTLLYVGVEFYENQVFLKQQWQSVQGTNLNKKCAFVLSYVLLSKH